MTSKTWTVNLDGQRHQVELREGVVTRSRTILIDGGKLTLSPKERRKPWGMGTQHKFEFQGHICLIEVQLTGIRYDYVLAVDGADVETGKAVQDQEELEGTPEAINANRVVAVLAFTTGGLLFSLWNYAVAHNAQYYYPWMALVGPPLIVFAAYYAIFEEDPKVLPKPIPFRLVAFAAVAIALGLVNWFLTEYGFY